MSGTLPALQLRQIFVLLPEIVLSVWGLLVLIVDLGWLRDRPALERRNRLCRLAVIGALLTVVAAIVLLVIRFDLNPMTVLEPYIPTSWMIDFHPQKSWNFAGIDYEATSDPYLFYGTISSDLLTESFNVLLATLLVFVVWMSGCWSFTENWGEYFALILWSTVGMMLLTASEELLTLFLTLETMTICLYLATAFEKDKRRSAEGGLKYFVYGSVSSALFLFGLSLIYGLTGSTRLAAIHDTLMPPMRQIVGLQDNVAGATAVLLVLVGFGFKVAAVPFHQWAPDAYEGAPAPVTAWIATGSKVASFIALMKILLHALVPWSNNETGYTSPGWIMIVAVLAAASMTYGNFAALAQKNLKRMLAYSSIAHAGYMLVGVAAGGLSTHHALGAGAVLYYLVVYAFSNIGAFALATWLAKDKGSDEIDDLNGLGLAYPGLGVCIVLLMLSLIGMPPLAGFFGKLYMFMEALDQSSAVPGRMTLLWLVALGLLNSVISAFYYVRVLKAMFLRRDSGAPLSPPPRSISAPIVLSTLAVLALGIRPDPLIELARGMALPMLSDSGPVGQMVNEPSAPPPRVPYTGPRIFPAGIGVGGPTPPAPTEVTAPKGAATKGAQQNLGRSPGAMPPGYPAPITPPKAQPKGADDTAPPAKTQQTTKGAATKNGGTSEAVPKK